MAHLPTTLRSLRAPAIAGDATIAAFARCPSLEELSWNGNTFTSKGVRALVDSGAFERLTRIQLSEALGREEARELFALAAPARLHDLDLSGLALGDGTMRKVARAPAWTDRLVTLDLQDNELSSRGLADFLDALVERAEALASIAVDGNKLGPEVFDRLALLRKRGVAVDVDAPTTKPSRAPQPKDPAPTVALAWNRIETWLAKNKTVIPGLGSPAKRAAITKAAHLPGTLRALYALHDASPEADVLGLGRIVWWPLADVGGDALTEIDDRELAVFAAPVDEATREAGTLPSFDDDFDSLLAVAADTEEVVLVGRKGHVDVVAEHLGIALGRVADALEAGTKRFDDRGRLVEMKAPPPPPQNPAPVAKLSFIEEFAAAIIDRHVVELRPGATAKDLAKAFEEAVRSEDPRTHVKAVLAVFDTPLVDDVFVDDDELKTLAKSFARQFA